jgi:hypothetical protein
MSVLKVYNGSAWETVGAPSGTSGAALLPLDVPPVSPHAKDDEFSGSSLDAKWTAPITSTRATTATVANGWVSINPNDAGGTRGGYGIRQAAPTGSFTVSAKVSALARVNSTGAFDVTGGLVVGRLSATAKGHALGAFGNGYARFVEAIAFTYSHTADWSAYDGYEANAVPEDHGPRWVKIKWDTGTSTLSFSYSGDGVFWTLLGTRASQQQPEYVGLAIYSNTAVGNDYYTAADWFRVTEP